jgi:hypothetical protein
VGYENLEGKLGMLLEIQQGQQVRGAQQYQGILGLCITAVKTVMKKHNTHLICNAE